MSESYRGRALEEYGEECAECDATDGIEVHHIDGDRNNNALDNLIPLCRHCHSRLHRSGLGGLEEQLKSVEDRSHIDDTVTTFGFTHNREEWEAWKNTVPRSKSLEKRINELIEADTDGRVDDDDRAADACQHLNRALEHRDWGLVEDAAAELKCDDE